MTRIALTGATGAVGRRVARRLADLGPRLVVRDPSRLELPGLESARADYGDADALRAAFADVDVLFFVSGAESADRRDQHRTVVAAAAEAGVRHVVYTSFDGAAPDAEFTLGRDHFDTEQTIRASGMRATFLRDNFYADFVPLFAGDDGVVRGPAGDGRFAPVARADVADAAAAVLRAVASGHPDAHADRTYVLTGPESMTMAEAVARAAAATGRDLTYEAETVDEAYASRAHYGAPQWQLDAWVSTYTAIASGALATVSPDVERLTGHPARTIERAIAGD